MGERLSFWANLREVFRLLRDGYIGLREFDRIWREKGPPPRE